MKTMSASTTRWIVVNTHPHREKLAMKNLEQQDFIVYCPMMMKRIRHARRTTDEPRPIFPGYIFVNYDNAKHRWRPILSTYGVRAVIQQGEEPSLLDGQFIDLLKAREIDNVVQNSKSTYKIGQGVAIEAGPFDGLIGKIIELRAKDRIVILLDILNQKSKVEINTRAQNLRVL